MQQRRPTMGDVARLAGVSSMSVSRLLNNSGPVSPEIASRIRWSVEKLDYRLNEVARSLRGQRSRLIGVIVPNRSDPSFATCAHEIDLVAKAHGVTVAVASSGGDIEVEQKEAHALVQRNVDGLVVVPADTTSDYLTRSTFADIPVIFLDRPGADASRDTVLVQNDEGVRLGVEHLLERGYQRVAFLGDEEDTVQTMRIRYKAYCKTLRLHRLEPLSYLYCPVPDQLDATLSDLRRSEKTPTAIFTAHGPSTKAVLASLRRLNLRLPADFALVGFDDFEMADLIEPGITVVSQPVRQLARVTAELLFERLQEGSSAVPPISRVMPLELIIRGSSAARA